MTTRLRRSLALPLLLLVALCGCVNLPEESDVEVRAEAQRSDLDTGFPYQPRPPQAGESPTEIVRHFFDAMTASPITTSVARQFLTEQARDAWQPDAGIITYADLVTPVGATQVSVGLVGANRVDAGGRWQGPLDEDEAELQFELVTEGGEWRIDSLPDAMIVPDNWFQDRYVQMNLHFFDPTGRVLVPEPVYVPRGGQAATSLVRGLLRGPDSELAGVTQSFVPQGLSLDVLVPEPVDGFAEVLLTGDVAAVDPATSELLVAQFAWTLRQVPNLTRFRLSLNGTPLGASGTAADIAVSRGEPYDPAVPEGWSDAFGIADGDLVTVSSRGLSAVEGERKSATSEWRSFAVDLSAGRVASVDATGQRVDVMPLNGSLAPVRAIQGVDLLKPAWDHSKTLWALDRGAQGAVVWAMPGRRAAQVQVPGITGERVRDFIVSRDGSRMVAVVAGARGDRVVAARIARNRGRIRALAPTVIWQEPGERLDLRAVAWRNPTEVLVVRKLGPSLSQVVRRSVDGSEAISRGDVSSELVRDRVATLVSTPVSGLPAWAVGRQGAFHVVASEGERFIPLDGVRAVTYAG